MQRPRARRAAFATGLALLGSTALVVPTLAWAQEGVAQPQPSAPPPAGQQEGVVQRIIVRGNERIEQSTILSYLPIQPGETLDAAKADGSLNRNAEKWLKQPLPADL